MKNLVVVVMVVAVAMAIAPQALAQSTLGNCARGTAIGAGIGAILDGRSGAWKGGAAGCAAGIILPKVSRPRESRRTTQQIDPRSQQVGPAPSLEGKSVVLCFQQGIGCRSAYSPAEQQIVANGEQSFSELGARVIRSSTPNPCENPDLPKVVCVVYGLPLQNGGQYGQDNGGFSTRPLGGWGGGSTQIQTISVNVGVSLYDNSNVDQYGRVQSSTIIPIASAVGTGNTKDGQSYGGGSVRGNNGSIYGGGGSSRYTNPELAYLAATARATNALVNGAGWLPRAETELAQLSASK